MRVAAVVSPNEGRHPFADALESDGVSTTVIRVGDRDYVGERRAIRELCRRDRPDIVHTHGFRPDVVDGGVARREGIPIVSTCHGFIDSTTRGRFYQRLQRLALRRFDAVIAVSGPIADRVRAAGVDARKVHLVPNVFASGTAALGRADARKRLDLPDAPVIGWVGRLSTEKGPDIALHAFARLARPDVRLVVIGTGPDEAALRERAVTLGIEKSILWRGVIPDAGALFAAFDVFLLSSRTEGTPIALLEAIGAGVPVVATRVGGVPDMIDESSARLVESGDPGALAAALAEVLDELARARASAERARAKLVSPNAAESWLARYESIYRAVVGDRRHKSSSAQRS